ncbi:MAG: alginate export family protein, partial [Bryobacteraceae bacterium]
LDRIRIETFGGHSAHAIDSGGATFDILLWGVAQTGKWGVQSHRAHAIDIEAGFQPKRGGRLKPWFRGGFFDGSGDSNPNDNRHGTFFQVLPTPRPFARFPFFNLMNNRDRFGMMILRPHAKVTVSSEVHAMRLSNRNDFWYQGGGVFQPWTFGYSGRASGGATSLGNLYDTSVEFRCRPNVTFTGYFGVAQGLAIVNSIYPKGQRALLGYVEALYRF